MRIHLDRKERLQLIQIAQRGEMDTKELPRLYQAIAMDVVAESLKPKRI